MSLTMRDIPTTKVVHGIQKLLLLPQMRHINYEVFSNDYQVNYCKPCSRIDCLASNQNQSNIDIF